jgi:hypothetical protein
LEEKLVSLAGVPRHDGRNSARHEQASSGEGEGEGKGEGEVVRRRESLEEAFARIKREEQAVCT